MHGGNFCNLCHRTYFWYLTNVQLPEVMHWRNLKYNEFLSFLLPCVPSSRCFSIAVVRFAVRFRDSVYSSRYGSDLKNKMRNNAKPQPVEP